MNREGVLGLLLIALLFGGIVLFARRPVTTNYASTPRQYSSQGNIRVIPVKAEPRRYQNKEIREVEFGYNGDGELSKLKMVITRDYAVT